MLGPFEVFQKPLQRRFQRFHVLIAAKAIVRVESEVMQMRRADLMARRASGVAIGLRQRTGQRFRGGMAVKDEDAFRGHVRLPQLK